MFLAGNVLDWLHHSPGKPRVNLHVCMHVSQCHTSWPVSNSCATLRAIAVNRTDCVAFALPFAFCLHTLPLQVFT